MKIVADSDAQTAEGSANSNRRKRSKQLAYAAFVLVCLSIPTAGLFLLPGLVCGHLALRLCDPDDAPLESEYAFRALKIGYGLLVVLLALVILGSFAWGRSTEAQKYWCPERKAAL